MAKTLVVILEDGSRELKTAEVEQAMEDGDSCVAYNADGQVMARFKLHDIRSWYLE